MPSFPSGIGCPEGTPFNTWARREVFQVSETKKSPLESRPTCIQQQKNSYQFRKVPCLPTIDRFWGWPIGLWSYSGDAAQIAPTQDAPHLVFARKKMRRCPIRFYGKGGVAIFRGLHNSAVRKKRFSKGARPFSLPNYDLASEFFWTGSTHGPSLLLPFFSFLNVRPVYWKGRQVVFPRPFLAPGGCCHPLFDFSFPKRVLISCEKKSFLRKMAPGALPARV